MTRDPLLERLRTLPQEKASSGFTDRVLEGLGDGRLRARRSSLAVVALVVVVAGAAAGWWYLTASSPQVRRLQEMRRELAAMRAEQHRLQADWKALRRLEAQTEPVLYLQGNDNLDLILDLRQVPPGALRVEVEPAKSKQRSPLS